MYPMILSRDAIFHGTKLRSRLHVFRKSLGWRIVCTYILQFILSSDICMHVCNVVEDLFGFGRFHCHMPGLNWRIGI